MGCWKVSAQGDFVCHAPWLREIEYGFRQILVKRDIDDDTPVEPWFAVRAVFDVSPGNIWGVDIGRHESTEEGGAWGFDPPLKAPEDFSRLRMPTYTYNAAETQAALDRAHDLLGDILPVRLECGTHLSGTLCHYAAALRGLGDHVGHGHDPTWSTA